MSDVTWLVGNDLPAPWSSERACQFGDGLFETLAVIEGSPCLWSLHLQRLLLGCERLALPKPDTRRLERECARVCKDVDQAALKIFWTAGNSLRGYRRPAEVKPTCLLQLSPWTRPADDDTWRLTLCNYRLSENPVLAGIKHLNRLDQVLGRNEWLEKDIDEGLMRGQDGSVVCGTMSNIVVDRAGQLMTPAIKSAGVCGVVRSCLLEQGQRHNTPVLVGELHVADVKKADAVYMMNALIGVRRVSRFENVSFDLGRPHPTLIDSVRRLVFRPAFGSSEEST
jgi:4-amino-4-deoxychorismate lyase